MDEPLAALDPMIRADLQRGRDVIAEGGRHIGSGGDHPADGPSAWTAVGQAHVIADNLIAEGKMVPMIIVFPSGNATAEEVAEEVH